MEEVILILAGGFGERLWPLSRKEKPKQILHLKPDRPLILETINRFKKFKQVYIISNNSLKEEFQKILPPSIKYIEEPSSRNTAAAIGIALIHLQRKFGNHMLFIANSDQILSNYLILLEEIQKSFKFALKNKKIIIFGTCPNSPHTGYGYIKLSKPEHGGFFKIESFKEKPDYNTAVQYLNDGNFLWNSGMLCARSSDLMKEFELNLPDMYKSLISIKNSNFDKDQISREFNLMEKISISRGILERSKNVLVLKSKVKWQDIGNFNELPETYFSFIGSNKSTSVVKTIGSQNCTIISKKLVGLIGIDDCIVVDTNDVLLICKNTETLKIKDLIKKVDKKYR